MSSCRAALRSQYAFPSNPKPQNRNKLQILASPKQWIRGRTGIPAPIASLSTAMVTSASWRGFKIRMLSVSYRAA
jgi:hypothetical protein